MLIKKFLFINLLDQEGEEREGESYSFWLSEFFNLEIGGRRVPLFSLIMWVEMCNSNTRSCILHLVASLVPPSSSKVLSKAMKPFNSSFPRGVRWWCIPQHQLQLIHSDRHLMIFWLRIEDGSTWNARIKRKIFCRVVNVGLTWGQLSTSTQWEDNGGDCEVFRGRTNSITLL